MAQDQDTIVNEVRCVWQSSRKRFAAQRVGTDGTTTRSLISDSTVDDCKSSDQWDRELRFLKELFAAQTKHTTLRRLRNPEVAVNSSSSLVERK